jgi:hypothetical protein
VNCRPRSTAILAAAAAVLLTSGGVSAQRPSLNDVLRRAAEYLAAYQKQLSEITAEETYVQDVVPLRPVRALEAPARRTLRSDLLLVKPRGADRYVEYRDVFEVDGKPVRDRQERLARLLRDPSASSSRQIQRIIGESARYNIGDIVRNINTPMLPLMFLDAAFQPRFAFKRQARPRPVLTPGAGAGIDETAVFRVSTEMWAIEFRERRRPTIIRTPNGEAIPTRGRLWVNPDTGAVLISELAVDGDGVDATITTSYQSEPLMGFLVPVEMRETYKAAGERITGTATYGRFRPIQP